MTTTFSSWRDLTRKTTTINTIKGDLEIREGGFDDDNESTTWIEYWLDGELIHRSATVHLKMALFGLSEVETLE